ncbi:dynein intermediate chain 3, ciliary-like isoform X2 [Daktulosphaira vitifoliae]|uniref:dynein intermediate chain 3, ciliary-like isoform X2 n=1 Tax=Daktulosphaira vitifoliae TaxID=58002 RepID=UPI0021AA9B5C|nr:dynein intermediate chain 3, ciliary-like isoform X2 [Daktulosphaira vitifoliae]
MYSNFTYAKLRREFGRQCVFSKWGPRFLENLLPDSNLEYQWITKNPCNRSTNLGVDWSEHEVNTIRAEYVDRGIAHVEGGWPKDVNLDDPEQVTRFRKKAEKDDSYMHAVLQMSKLTEHFINQNNSIDIYEPYFVDPICQDVQTVSPSYRSIAVMSDPSNLTRPVQHLSWSPDEASKIAVSYANVEFETRGSSNSPNSYIFDLEDSTMPSFIVTSQFPIVKLEFNSRDKNNLAGGLISGQVACWDTRKGSDCIAMSNLKNSHRDPVTGIYWIHSKTGTEFYSGSSDGQVMWWDTRKLDEPTEVLLLDLTKTEDEEEQDWVKWSRSHGITCMDYDPLLPIRFMIGTETGLVFNGNRKVGDWQVRIWSEDCKDSPIMWTKRHEIRLIDGAWSETKPSVFYSARVDGCLDTWDILQEQKNPIITIRVSDKSLNCVRCHENGSLLGVGDISGNTFIIQMNDWFVSPGKNDKALLTAMFDRETKREKIIEAKLREFKLKTKAAKELISTKDKRTQIAVAEAKLIEEAEKQFFEVITNEVKENEYIKGENFEEEESILEDESPYVIN